MTARDALAFQGRTVRGKGGIVRFIPEPPEQVNARGWTDERLKSAHAAYWRGLRDEHTVAGHREWDRRYRAKRRAAQRQRMSAEDMAWCEKAAEKGKRLQQERAWRRADMSYLSKLSSPLSTTAKTAPIPPVDNGLSKGGDHVFHEANDIPKEAA